VPFFIGEKEDIVLFKIKKKNPQIVALLRIFLSKDLKVGHSGFVKTWVPLYYIFVT
jgi:hypothetical protein